MRQVLQTPDDGVVRFMFEHFPVRGEHVALDRTWRDVARRMDYPPVVRSLLGQAVAAVTLLAGSVKGQASVTVQVQGDGPVHLLVVQCSSDGDLRGLARWKDPIPESADAEDAQTLLGDGRLAITLEPKGHGRRYQAVVPLEGRNLAGVFEGYFTQSEQLDTRLWLSADGDRVGGLLLQQLPGAAESDDLHEGWRRVGMLSDTISERELRELTAGSLIHRLFHEEDVRVFRPRPVRFHCHCSRERIENVLQSLGRERLADCTEEDGTVSVNCEFCNEEYRFDRVELERILRGEPTPPHPGTYQ